MFCFDLSVLLCLLCALKVFLLFLIGLTSSKWSKLSVTIGGCGLIITLLIFSMPVCWRKIGRIKKRDDPVHTELECDYSSSDITIVRKVKIPWNLLTVKSTTQTL